MASCIVGSFWVKALASKFSLGIKHQENLSCILVRLDVRPEAVPLELENLYIVTLVFGGGKPLISFLGRGKLIILYERDLIAHFQCSSRVSLRQKKKKSINRRSGSSPSINSC